MRMVLVVVFAVILVTISASSFAFHKHAKKTYNFENEAIKAYRVCIAQGILTHTAYNRPCIGTILLA